MKLFNFQILLAKFTLGIYIKNKFTWVEDLHCIG